MKFPVSVITKTVSFCCLDYGGEEAKLFSFFLSSSLQYSLVNLQGKRKSVEKEDEGDVAVKEVKTKKNKKESSRVE